MGIHEQVVRDQVSNAQKREAADFNEVAVLFIMVTSMKSVSFTILCKTRCFY